MLTFTIRKVKRKVSTSSVDLTIVTKVVWSVKNASAAARCRPTVQSTRNTTTHQRFFDPEFVKSNKIKRGICKPIDGIPLTLTHQDYFGVHGRLSKPKSAPAVTCGDSPSPPRIFSKKDKKKRDDCHIGNMRNSMHFYTTYKDWYYQNALPTLYK